MAVNECYTKGGWSDRFTMCRGQNKAFSRCYIMQSVRSISHCTTPHHHITLHYNPLQESRLGMAGRTDSLMLQVGTYRDS